MSTRDTTQFTTGYEFESTSTHIFFPFEFKSHGLTSRLSIEDFKKKLVLAHHINVGGINYGAWTERVDSRTPELLTADLAAFEAGIRELLTELKTSHTVFYHSLPKEQLPQHTINASLRDVPVNGARKCMFLDVFEGGPAHLAGIRPGDFLDAVDGTACLPPATPDFAIGHTHTLGVRDAGNGSQKEIVVEVPKRKKSKRPPIIEPNSPIHSKIGSNFLRSRTFRVPWE